MFHEQVLGTMGRHKHPWKRFEELKTFSSNQRSVVAPVSLSFLAYEVGVTRQAGRTRELCAITDKEGLCLPRTC